MFLFLFLFLGNTRCPGQLTRTTINSWTHWTPCKASRQVKHRGGDRRARWGSNLGDRKKKTLPLPSPGALLQVVEEIFYLFYVFKVEFWTTISDKVVKKIYFLM